MDGASVCFNFLARGLVIEASTTSTAMEASIVPLKIVPLMIVPLKGVIVR
jgi:hypothetical protein